MVILRNPFPTPAEILQYFCSGGHTNNGCENRAYSAYARDLLNCFATEFIDRKTIYIPEYICEIAVMPFRRNGWKIVYYSLTDEMKIDFDSLIVEKESVLLTSSMFGYGDNYGEIRAICDEHDLIWLHDVAAGLGSYQYGKQLYEYGDISIVSFRKTCPVPNGAFIQLNTGNLAHRFENIKKVSQNFSKKNETASYLVRSILFLLGRSYTLHDDTAISASWDDGMKYTLLSRRTRFLFESKFEVKTCLQRLTLYGQIVSALIDTDKFKPIVADVKAGNIPTAVIIECENNTLRNNLLNKARDLGLDWYTWPMLPKEILESKMESAMEKWKRIAFAPVSDRYDDGYMDRVKRLLSAI